MSGSLASEVGIHNDVGPDLLDVGPDLVILFVMTLNNEIRKTVCRKVTRGGQYNDVQDYEPKTPTRNISGPSPAHETSTSHFLNLIGAV